MKVKANGIQLNYAIDGDGPWVVMSHSLACSLEMWDRAGRGAQEQDTRCCASTPAAMARSDAPAGAYTLEQLADDLHGLLQALKVERPHFVGLSMGGMIGMTYALKYPGPVPQPGVVRHVQPARAGSAAGVGRSHQDRHREGHGAAGGAHPQALVHRADGDQASAAFWTRCAAMIRATPPAGYAGCCHAIPKINVTDRLEGDQVPDPGHRRRPGRRDAGGDVARDPGGRAGVRAGRDSRRVAPVQPGAAGGVQQCADWFLVSRSLTGAATHREQRNTRRQACPRPDRGAPRTPRRANTVMDWSLSSFHLG